MNFDNPAWRTAPVRTGFRVLKSILRRRAPQLGRVAVGYDDNRTRIYADLGTPLGLQLYRYGHRDPDIELVGRLLSRGDMFVDGGANVGLFTLVAAERVGKLGKVLAFEPGRVVRLRLLENVVLNGFQQVVVMPFALSSQPGEARLRVFDSAGAGLNHLVSGPNDDGDVETVACTTLDAAIVDGDRPAVAARETGSGRRRVRCAFRRMPSCANHGRTSCSRSSRRTCGEWAATLTQSRVCCARRATASIA